MSASFILPEERKSFNQEIEKCKGLKKRVRLALEYGLLKVDDFCPSFEIRDEELKRQYLSSFIDCRNEFAHGTGFLDIVWSMPPRIKLISNLINRLWPSD